MLNSSTNKNYSLNKSAVQEQFISACLKFIDKPLDNQNIDLMLDLQDTLLAMAGAHNTINTVLFNMGGYIVELLPENQ